jgi:hypothetical protein
MKLPDACPFAETSVIIDPSDIKHAGCCRVLGRAWLPEPEEPLCQSRQTEDEAYRFFWESSFHGDTVIHVGRKGKSITLRCRCCWQAPFVVGLPPTDWDKLERALSAASFWSLDWGSALPGGLDGAQWLVEGRRGGLYHAVHRWSPGGTVHDLGRLFFSLAGRPLAGIDLY